MRPGARFETVSLEKKDLMAVEVPSRYTGGEKNACLKPDFLARVKKGDDRDVAHVALCFPDIYDIGMSNLAMQILYHALNLRDDIYCERAFSPWVDMDRLLREKQKHLFSLESKTALASFDVIGFSLQYELSYTNVMQMLDLSDVPLDARERVDSDPIVVAGGPIVCNIEPVAYLFDAVIIGEAEESFLAFLSLYINYKKRSSTMSRRDFLRETATLPGVYVPLLYEDKDGKLKPVDPCVPAVIRKTIVSNIDQAVYPTHPIVPHVRLTHDRAAIELFRGCSRGCRFCQAGFTYRPIRQKSAETLKKQALTLEKTAGYEEIGLLSLSTSDYSELHPLIDQLSDTLDANHTSISLPSLRLDSFSLALLDRVSHTRKTGLTFAPEAGTQRLRDVINKGITEDEILEGLSAAFEKGYHTIKLYFMLGLPTETDEDILGIAQLCEKIRSLYNEKRSSRRSLQMTVSTSIFVPKPFTPFQWEGQILIDEMRRRQSLLYTPLKRLKINFQWHDFATSFWEAVLARGDRHLFDVLVEGYLDGQFFDAWSEHFSLDRWLGRMENAGLDPNAYASRIKDVDEPLPWDHIDMGVNKAFLKKERARAMQGLISPPCTDTCLHCGANELDKKSCPPPSFLPYDKEDVGLAQSVQTNDKADTITYRVIFGRFDALIYTGHLDMMRIFERMVHRANLPMAYSKGYNPRPAMVFALPLGVGLAAKKDVLDLTLTTACDEKDLLALLQNECPAGLVLDDLYIFSSQKKSPMAEVKAASYQISAPKIAEALCRLMEKKTLVVKKKSKKRLIDKDIRPLIISVDASDGDDVANVLVLAGSDANLRPDLLLQAAVLYQSYPRDAAENADVVRTRLFSEVAADLIPMDAHEGLVSTNKKD